MDAHIFQANIYCKECAGGIKHELIMASKPDAFDLDNLDNYTSDQWPQGPFPNGGGEADSPQHCKSCSLFLESALTENGEEWVKGYVSNIGTLNKSINGNLYKEFYSYLFEDNQ